MRHKMSKINIMANAGSKYLMSYVKKIAKQRSAMQTEKSHPSGQRVMPETRSMYPSGLIRQ